MWELCICRQKYFIWRNANLGLINRSYDNILIWGCVILFFLHMCTGAGHCSDGSDFQQHKKYDAEGMRIVFCEGGLYVDLLVMPITMGIQ